MLNTIRNKRSLVMPIPTVPPSISIAVDDDGDADMSMDTSSRPDTSAEVMEADDVVVLEEEEEQEEQSTDSEDADLAE